MRVPGAFLARFLFVLAVAVLPIVPTPPPITVVDAQGAASSFKVAYYNIQSGMGTVALTGTCSFQRNANCTDPSAPLNAWGVGVVQAELQRAVNDDPAIIALGLSEAWACASPNAVLRTLGWKAHAGERNGVSLLARHGFAGAAEWIQLDTSLNTNPADTMWVVRAPVCVDAACSRSIQVFSAHWAGSGTNSRESYDRQARQTVAFMDRLPAAEPRLLVGDLNVWEEGGVVCGQNPVPSAVQILRDAENLDAWPAVHGLVEGYTGMWNRNGCGVPNGYLWKRIDHAWSKNLPRPVSMTRFGMVTPGICAPSDHAGIIVEYAWSEEIPDTTAPTVNVTAPAQAAALSGTVLVSASAADDVGVTRVGFMLDGVAIGEDTAPPYEFAWDTTTAQDGNHRLAAWAEDAAGNRGTSALVDVTVGNAPPPAPVIDFTLAASPASKRIQSGGAASYSVTTSLTSGSPAPIALSVSGLPAGATAGFDPASITGSGSSRLTIATTAITPAGDHTLTITGNGGSVTKTTTVLLKVLTRNR